MGFIRKIFEDNVDEEVHNEFIKYGKGNFEDRYEVRVKSQKKGEQFSLWTSHEFSNLLVKKCLERSDENIDVEGIIISTFEIDDDIDFPVKDRKKYMGMVKYIIDDTCSRDKLLELLNKYPRIFYGLSFESGNSKLKVKKKSPRSAKPGSKKKEGKKSKINFCLLKTQNKEMVKDLLFDVSLDFKEVNVSHDINIDKIVYPENVEGLKPNEIREKARRGGEVIRKIDKDGKTEKKEKEFIV